MNKYFLLSVLSIFSFTVFSQWQSTSILSQGENISYAFSKVLASDEGFNTYQTSANEGVTWTSTGVSGVPSTGLRFGCVNGSTLYAHYNDKIFQSSDGLIWNTMSIPTSTADIVRAMCVLNGTVFASTSPSGISSKIFKLTGSSWNVVALHTGTIITALGGYSNALWAGTTSTLVLKSTDGGSTFAASNGTLNPTSTANKYCRSLAGNSNVIYMGNDQGRIFKSTDGGNTWAGSYNIGTSSAHAISDLYISPSGAVLAATDSGFVYSLDGTTWNKDNLGFTYTLGNLNDQLLKVTMSTNNIIVSTKNGKVYYRPAAQVLAGIKEVEISNIQSKVYPNPASSAATIEASDLMFEKDCEIKIHDVLGREVLIKEMNNGKAIIDLEGLDKGIYSYSLYHRNNAVGKGKMLVN